MTENFQDKLHQEESKQSEGAKICASIRRKLSVKNAPKLSAKHLQDKTCKIKQMQNIALTVRIFLNQLKTF